MVENTELVLYIGGGLWAFKEFVVPLVKGSFGRNLQQVDEHTKKVDALLEEHSKSIADLKGEQKSLLVTLGSIDGKLSGLDNRIAKQGEFHDQKLGDALANLATEFNRKLASTLNSELERVVREVVREELAPKRKR